MKLADIDPAAVARDVVRTVLEHLHSHAMRLDPTLLLAIPEDAGTLGLRATTEALAHYAQRGLPVWDWTHHGHAADALLDVIAALYSRAADGDLDRTAIDVLDDVDPDDAIGLVLVAAACRVKIDRENALLPRELGALAGLSASQVRHLIRTGEITGEGEGVRGDPVRVPAEDASRWLRARGVPGIEEERRPPGLALLSTPDEPTALDPLVVRVSPATSATTTVRDVPATGTATWARDPARRVVIEYVSAPLSTPDEPEDPTTP